MTTTAVSQSAASTMTEAIQDAILTAIHDFVGGVPQFDDIALLILGRDLA